MAVKPSVSAQRTQLELGQHCVHGMIRFCRQKAGWVTPSWYSATRSCEGSKSPVERADDALPPNTSHRFPLADLRDLRFEVISLTDGNVIIYCYFR